jgi:hypothetical protein
MMKKIIAVFMCVFVLFAAGCNRTVSIKQLADEYNLLVASKSLSDFSLLKIDRIKLIPYGVGVGQWPIESVNDVTSWPSSSTQTFSITSSGMFLLKKIDPNSDFSLNLGLSGKGISSGFTAGAAYKKGLVANQKGHYWLIGRVGYDFLSENIKIFFVTDGFNVENINLHQGTLEIILSPKIWLLKPFVSHQLALSNFSYKGERSENIINLFLLQGYGIEFNLDPWSFSVAFNVLNNPSAGVTNSSASSFSIGYNLNTNLY